MFGAVIVGEVPEAKAFEHGRVSAVGPRELHELVCQGGVAGDAARQVEIQPVLRRKPLQALIHGGNLVVGQAVLGLQHAAAGLQSATIGGWASLVHQPAGQAGAVDVARRADTPQHVANEEVDRREVNARRR